jgi:hypothetical protein
MIEESGICFLRSLSSLTIDNITTFKKGDLCYEYKKKDEGGDVIRSA